MEYQQIIAATERQFADEERDIEGRQADLDTAQALLDRRRKALAKKRRGFERMVSGWRTLDVEVVSGKPSRTEAGDDEDQDGDRQVARFLNESWKMARQWACRTSPSCTASATWHRSPTPAARRSSWPVACSPTARPASSISRPATSSVACATCCS